MGTREMPTTFWWKKQTGKKQLVQRQERKNNTKNGPQKSIGEREIDTSQITN
jgi:hypothetical protein